MVQGPEAGASLVCWVNSKVGWTGVKEVRKRNSSETEVMADLGDRNHCRVCEGGEMKGHIIQPAESTNACF